MNNIFNTLFNNIEQINQIKQQFYSYDKNKQKFLIYKIYIATALFLDFREKYKILERDNLHKDKYMLLKVTFIYFYLFNVYIILYITLDKNSLQNKMRRITYFSATLKNRKMLNK